MEGANFCDPFLIFGVLSMRFQLSVVSFSSFSCGAVLFLFPLTGSRLLWTPSFFSSCFGLPDLSSPFVVVCGF